MPSRLFQGEMKPVTCPACNVEQDGYTGVGTTGERPPESGDVLVCWYCGAVNVLQDDGSMVTVIGEELRALMIAEPRVATMVVGIVEMRSKEIGREQPSGD